VVQVLLLLVATLGALVGMTLVVRDVGKWPDFGPGMPVMLAFGALLAYLRFAPVWADDSDQDRREDPAASPRLGERLWRARGDLTGMQLKEQDRGTDMRPLLQRLAAISVAFAVALGVFLLPLGVVSVVVTAQSPRVGTALTVTAAVALLFAGSLLASWLTWPSLCWGTVAFRPAEGAGAESLPRRCEEPRQPGITAELRLEDGTAFRFIDAPGGMTFPAEGGLLLTAEGAASWRVRGFRLTRRSGTWRCLIEPGSLHGVEPGLLYRGGPPFAAVRLRVAGAGPSGPTTVVLSFGTEEERAAAGELLAPLVVL
jgi:hypothetical protein